MDEHSHTNQPNNGALKVYCNYLMMMFERNTILCTEKVRFGQEIETAVQVPRQGEARCLPSHIWRIAGPVKWQKVGPKSGKSMSASFISKQFTLFLV